MFRVIIAGSRDFNNYEYLCNTMDYLLSKKTDDITIVCGECRGADTLGKKYAVEHGYNIASYPADWNKYGKSAGHIRNTEMAKNADALVAFWDGISRGTKDMIVLAEKYGLVSRVVYVSQV